MIGMTGGAYN